MSENCELLRNKKERQERKKSLCSHSKHKRSPSSRSWEKICLVSQVFLGTIFRVEKFFQPLTIFKIVCSYLLFVSQSFSLCLSVWLAAGLTSSSSFASFSAAAVFFFFLCSSFSSAIRLNSLFCRRRRSVGLAETRKRKAQMKLAFLVAC